MPCGARSRWSNGCRAEWLLALACVLSTVFDVGCFSLSGAPPSKGAYETARSPTPDPSRPSQGPGASSARALSGQGPTGCSNATLTGDDKKVRFMVLGQQKCGTSSIWNILTKHPEVAQASHRKESFYWATGGSFHHELRWDACLWPTDAYYAFLEDDNTYRKMCPGQLIGDFTATHFSCPCCPERFFTLNPGMKLIVMLREPLSRSKSRFKEQQDLWGNYKDETFTLNVAAELHWMDSSNCHASRFLPRGIPHLDEIRELYCSAQSNIAGWSNYPVFLKNWLKHFPREQLLVLYTEQFDREPGMVLRAIHEFLGLQQYRYPDETMQQTHFNTQSCGYGWRDGCAEEQPEAVPSQGGGSDSDRSTNHPQNMQKFYDDAVRGVVDLARVGQVSMPPLSWFGNGRLERLNMTRYDYFKIHKDHIRNLPAATKQSKAIRELGKQSSKV